MLRLYRCLLRLYPVNHRELFGEEMIEVFRDVETETANKSTVARGVFCLRETAGLLTGALHEHWRALGGPSVWLPFPASLRTRRFTMRNGFRFPKTTAVLMTIILAGVIVAIEKGERIVASLMQGPHFDFLPAIVPIFLFVYAAAGIGWAILFALRRSGVHRLETSADQE